jgi:hypothetical protein
MSDPIKLTQDELEDLKRIQTLYQEKTFAFGQLYIEKLNLIEKQKSIDSIEIKLKQELVDTQKLEESWMEKITSKYGEGELNISSGTLQLK